MAAVMPFVAVVEVTSAPASRGSDCGAFRAARECSNQGASPRADGNAFDRLHVAAVPVIMGARLVVRGGYSCIRRSGSQKHTNRKNSGDQAIFHIHQLLVELAICSSQ
jgi:hypothetical protein